ncbi:MAG TPA: cysteine synthase family protein [Aridibacter sp.]|nr:cysteine synthase family protein [Aridibacter sp.]
MSTTVTGTGLSAGYAGLASLIGNTPLLRLKRLTIGFPDNIRIYAKAEHLNPGGSVKDRAALAMILDGERSGALRRGKTILDATSGNTGIAYAMLGAARGYKVVLTLPSNASPERKRILRSYGAVVIETDPLEATDGAQEEARRLKMASPDKFFYPDQYNNEANWRAHYETTGPEIWEQTGGSVTHFVAGLGTTGTFTGTTRRLQDYNPEIRAFSVQPDSPLHGLEGMKHLATAAVPGIYEAGLEDESLFVSTEDAQEMTRLLARVEGLFVGVSSGANVLAAVETARRLGQKGRGGSIVTVLCDGGERYLGENFWDAV